MVDAQLVHIKSPGKVDVLFRHSMVDAQLVHIKVRGRLMSYSDQYD